MSKKPTLMDALISEYVAIDLYRALMEKESTSIRERRRYREIADDEESHREMLEKHISAPKSYASPGYPKSLKGAIRSEKDAISLYSALLSGEGEKRLNAKEEEDIRAILTDEVEHLSELEALKRKKKR